MDAITFKQQFIPYHQKLYRIAYRLLEDEQDAEDITQETYIKLWNKRNELGHVENLESYSVIILRNMCMDYLRSKSRFKVQSQEILNVELSETVSVVAEIEQKEEFQFIEHIVNQLPKQQREVIKLKHFDNYTSDEIENILGISSINLRVLLSRARKKVKELFEKQNIYEN